MGKILNYKILGTALKSLSDACFKADEQQRNGEKITACGMSDEDLDRLCDIIPDMLNPMMSTEEVKEKLHTKDVAKDYWHEVKNDKINIVDWCVLWGEMVNRNDEKIRKWFPKIGTMDYERKIFDECISFLANGELPFYDLKV